MSLPEHDIVAHTVRDPHRKAGVSLLLGFLGKASHSNWTRLYLDVELRRSIDFPEGAIRYTAPSDLQFEPTWVWVSEDVEVEFGDLDYPRRRGTVMDAMALYATAGYGGWPSASSWGYAPVHFTGHYAYPTWPSYGHVGATFGPCVCSPPPHGGSFGTTTFGPCVCIPDPSGMQAQAQAKTFGPCVCIPTGGEAPAGVARAQTQMSGPCICGPQPPGPRTFGPCVCSPSPSEASAGMPCPCACPGSPCVCSPASVMGTAQPTGPCICIPQAGASAWPGTCAPSAAPFPCVPPTTQPSPGPTHPAADDTSADDKTDKTDEPGDKG